MKALKVTLASLLVSLAIPVTAHATDGVELAKQEYRECFDKHAAGPLEADDSVDNRIKTAVSHCSWEHETLGETIGWAEASAYMNQLSHGYWEGQTKRRHGVQ